MPSTSTSLFIDKAIERLDRLDREQIRNLLSSLKREREFLRSVFDRMAEGVLALGADWEILWSNKAARELLGLGERRRLLGEKLLDLPLDEEFLGLMRRQALPGSRPAREELFVKRPDDRILSVGVVGDGQEADTEAMTVVIIEDLTDQRLEQARRQEAEKIASLATLTAGVAHEIKNPLNSLQIHAQLLERMLADETVEPPRDRVRRSMEVILEEIGRLGGVVEQFLSAARPTRPELTPQRLQPVIDRLVELLRPELEEKDIDLDIDQDPDLIELQMDETEMMQALVNVARNAIEAIEARREREPEAEGLIGIRTRSDRKRVWITVSDTGCGIAQEDLKRIVEPYYTTKFSGTGLGMMVVYRVVREHNGRLDIQSEVGAGTTVTLTLPRERRPPKELPSQSVVDAETAYLATRTGEDDAPETADR